MMKGTVLILLPDGSSEFGEIIGRADSFCCGKRGYVIATDDCDIEAICHKRVFEWNPGMTTEIGIA